MEEFDLAVIGAGPGGCAGAIRAAQPGNKVICIEKHSTLGGTCLNIGCIPSKALLNFSEKYEEARTHFADIGTNADVKLDLTRMLAKKDKVVGDLCKGIESLFVKNKINKIKEIAKIIDPNTIKITEGTNNTKIKAKNILIATGSQIINVLGININEKNIVSSTGTLSLSKAPNKMVIIAGGPIGLELGSVWRRLGSKITAMNMRGELFQLLMRKSVNLFTKYLRAMDLNLCLVPKC
jgi:dihydrolipoamide dehydrogenase